MATDYDVIVVGAGHAGVEAALACARVGHKTAIITLNKDKIALMPCNPSIGGSAKGIVVREIDALGGQMGKTADATALQFKLLNQSRGPAVWSIRVQSDKIAYAKMMQKILLTTKNLTVVEALVAKLLINDKKEVYGILCYNGKKITSKIVILTTGTYMNSLTLQGLKSKNEGPDQQPTTNGISEQLAQLSFKLLRLKTGTPPRLARDSIDFSQATLELGSAMPLAFSHDNDHFLPLHQQLPCYLIYTNSKTHEIINNNLHQSPIYGGNCTAIGPRYCPSIEDKVVRFADKERHQIFLEPESKSLDTIYVQGLSTSLPIDIQQQILQTLPGLANCRVVKWAYAIEYDAIEPTQLQATLETKIIKNLFTAGQINGTSGYEEAACQGLMAGINAHLRLVNQPPLILKRDEAYIGVLIDDLITKGTKEPYRLLTSLAEHRLLLRNDNVQTRLIAHGHRVGLVSEEQWSQWQKKQATMKELIQQFKLLKIKQDSLLALKLKQELNVIIPDNSISIYELLKRPAIKLKMFSDLIPLIKTLNNNQQLELEIAIKFAGYIKQQEKLAQQMLAFESKKIPPDINYDKVASITLQAREKLKQIQPRTIAHAARISGVSPADIHMLLFFLKKTYPYQ